MSDPEWGGADQGSSAEGDEPEFSDEVSEVSGESEGGRARGGGRRGTGGGTQRTLRSAGAGSP